MYTVSNEENVNKRRDRIEWRKFSIYLREHTPGQSSLHAKAKKYSIHLPLKMVYITYILS